MMRFFTPQEYKDLPPLCQYIYDLLVAGMGIKNAVGHGFAMAMNLVNEATLAELQATKSSQALIDHSEVDFRAARLLRDACHHLEIDLFSQQKEMNEASVNWRARG